MAVGGAEEKHMSRSGQQHMLHFLIFLLETTTGPIWALKREVRNINSYGTAAILVVRQRCGEVQESITIQDAGRKEC